MGTKARSRKDDRVNLLGNVAPKKQGENADGLLPDLPEAAEAFPILNAMLTVNEMNGKPRQTATVTFWVEDWGCKGVLSDRACKRKLWATSPSLMGLLGEFESQLASGSPPWRDESGTRSKRS
jgi:hypothetical protein